MIKERRCGFAMTLFVKFFEKDWKPRFKGTKQSISGDKGKENLAETR